MLGALLFLVPSGVDRLLSGSLRPVSLRGRKPIAVTLPVTPSPLLSVEEVAEYLRLSPRWVYEEVRTGRLRAVRIARSWRIKVSDLDEFVESFRP